MATVELRFYGPLVDLLPNGSGRSIRRPLVQGCTVKDTVESCNVPHTEVALLVVDGEPVAFDLQLWGDERVAVYPRFWQLPAVTDEPAPKRFVLDVHLRRLARLLRLLGVDVSWWEGAEDDELAEVADLQQRTLLTRDVGLLKRGRVRHGALVRADDPEEQAVEVIDRFDLADDLAPFTRCVRCNGLLEAVDKAEIEAELEPGTRRSYERFSRCASCGQVYWQGAHHDQLERTVARMLERAGDDRPAATRCRSGTPRPPAGASPA